MALKRVRLELARNDDFPEGSPNHGYEVTLPLTNDHKFDTAAFDDDAQLCTLVKFAADADDQHGQVVRSEGGGWAFSYELGDADDEPVFRMESHVFKPNEYITVTDSDEAEHVYRVVLVDDLHFPGKS